MKTCNAFYAVLLSSALLLIHAGCEQTTSESQPAARPVSFVVLKKSDPTRLNRLTGSVESWKREMLSSRVAGRVASVIEPGLTIEGRVVDDDNEVVFSGTLLATLDRDRYLLERDEAKARVDLFQARLNQAEIELGQAVPERINEATAERDRRKSEFERERKLLDQNATSRSDYEEAENWFRQAEASLAQAEIEKATKAAELEALKAQTREAEQMLRQAEVDLADCEVYSPFTGQVSKVHAIAGANVEEGMPIVTVQMMDPVKVELAVSEKTDRRIRYDDMLNVHVDSLDEPISGFVYLKDTVADAATRTFSVTILIRNREVELDLPKEYEGQDLPRTTDLFNLESKNADGKPPFYTDQQTIHTDADGRTFVWKVEGLTLKDLHGPFKPVFKVKKVYVELGDGVLPILELYRGRELSDLGGLDPANDLVTGRLPNDVVDDAEVFLSRKEWLLRPGQLVHVDLRGETAEPGFYVPRPAIQRSDGRHYVFLAQSNGSSGEQAKRVEVEVGPLIHDFRRIEAVEEGGLGMGDRVILDGAHYLRDGDAVNAFDEVEVSL